MKMLMFIFLLLLNVVSCQTNRTYNQVYSSKVRFQYGRYMNQEWKETLVFNRSSFVNGARTLLDVLWVRLDQDSPFQKWFGKEKRRCLRPYIGMFYKDLVALSQLSISTSELISQLKEQGLEDFTSISFSHHIKTHPNFEDWDLRQHIIRFFCSKNNNDDDHPELYVPSFPKVRL